MTARPSLDRPLLGRRALVTGASRGIGAAIARGLADQGADVIITARTAAALEQVAADIRSVGVLALVVTADLARRGDLIALMDRVKADLGGLDILVNNAGMLPTAQPAESVSWAAWDSAMALNLNAPWFLACRARELMTSGGVVVNIASTAAYYPSRGLVAYNVGKSALVMLTKVLALEWAREGIRVVGVAPGKIDTDLVTPIVQWSAKRARQLNPMNRLGHDHEVAELVKYLVSDESAYLTGVTVPLDGGELLAP